MAATPAPGPDQAVYILDKSLIRFGKFIGAVLTLFTLVGGIIWGFKIDTASERVRDAAEDVRKAQADIRDMQLTIRESQDQVRKTNQQILKTAESVEANRKQVESSQQQVQDVLAKAQRDAKKLLSQIKEDAQMAHRYTVLLIRGGPSSGLPQTLRSQSPMATAAPLSVPDIAKLYDFPTESDGRGETIGLIELGGGYSDLDLAAYFARLNLSKPKITSVSVQGARNQPGTEADAQVTLDIEVVGAVAPGAHIVAYFAPNTNSGFIDAVNVAVHDAANRPSVLCISWGSPESEWSPAMMSELNDTFKTASMLGVTVVTAAGDRGVTDGIEDGEGHIDFPASSPFVLAVGGTHLVSSEGKITSEVVWNDRPGGATGGGSSAVFPRPDWQSGVKVPARKDGKTGRGIPDIAANAAPESGYLVYIHGQPTQVGGTSASGPLWAGLITLINQGLGRKVGYINPLLYNKLGPDGVLRDIIEGDNGADGVKGYTAGPGWDACTGWGSPSGRKLLAAFETPR